MDADMLTYLAGATSTGLVWTLHEIRRNRRMRQEKANQTIDGVVNDFQELLYRERGVPTNPLVRKIFLNNEARREAAKRSPAQEDTSEVEYQDDLAFGGLMDEIDSSIENTQGTELLVAKQGPQMSDDKQALLFKRINGGVSVVTSTMADYFSPVATAYRKVMDGAASLSTRVGRAASNGFARHVKPTLMKPFSKPSHPGYTCFKQVIEDNLNGSAERHKEVIDMYNRLLPASRICEEDHRKQSKQVLFQLERRLGEAIADDVRRISGYVHGEWPENFDPMELSKVFGVSFANHKYGSDSPEYYVHKLMAREQL